MLCYIVVKHKPLPQNYDSSSNARSGLLANLKGACNKRSVEDVTVLGAISAIVDTVSFYLQLPPLVTCPMVSAPTHL